MNDTLKPRGRWSHEANSAGSVRFAQPEDAEGSWRTAGACGKNSARCRYFVVFFGIILLRTTKILLWGISEYDFFWKIYPFMSCRRVHFSIWPWWWIFGCFWYTVYIINLNFCRFYFGYDWNGTMVGTKGMFNREGQLLRNMIADMPLTRLVYGYIGGCLK